jgi:hypothetical protein
LRVHGLALAIDVAAQDARNKAFSKKALYVRVARPEVAESWATPNLVISVIFDNGEVPGSKLQGMRFPVTVTYLH